MTSSSSWRLLSSISCPLAEPLIIPPAVQLVVPAHHAVASRDDGNGLTYARATWRQAEYVVYLDSPEVQNAPLAWPHDYGHTGVELSIAIPHAESRRPTYLDCKSGRSLRVIRRGQVHRGASSGMAMGSGVTRSLPQAAQCGGQVTCLGRLGLMAALPL